MATRRDPDPTLRLVIIVLAALILAPLLLMALMVPLFGLWGGMMGGVGGGMAGVGVVASLVWLAVLVGGGYLVYRAVAGGGSVGADPALEELRLAYARGELSDEEFEERRATLEEA